MRVHRRKGSPISLFASCEAKLSHLPVHVAFSLPTLGEGWGWGLFSPPHHLAKLNRLAPTQPSPPRGRVLQFVIQRRSFQSAVRPSPSISAPMSRSQPTSTRFELCAAV